MSIFVKSVGALVLLYGCRNTDQMSSKFDGVPVRSSVSRYDRLVSTPDIEYERSRGIHECFFDKEIIDIKSESGWDLIQCDDSYATFIPKSLGIFVEKNLRVDKITVFKKSKFEETVVKEMQSRANETRSPEFQNALSNKFNIPNHISKSLKYGGFLDNKDNVFGSVSINLNDNLVCDFTFPDNPNPDTKCRMIVNDLIFQMETASINYTSIIESMESFAREFAK